MDKTLACGRCGRAIRLQTRKWNQQRRQAREKERRT